MTAPDGPRPDQRSALFATFDAEGRERTVTYEDLRRHTDVWPRTANTPPGAAALLRTSRETFALAMYHYELFVVAAAWALMAVEASLQERYPGKRTQFAHLIERAEREGVVSAQWAERLQLGRELRNTLMHLNTETAWSPGMSGGTVQVCHEAIATIYPDPTK